MSSSIAGATTTGQVDDKYTAINKLSQAPEAILESVLHVSGAINNKSAHLPSITWFDQESFSDNADKTSFLESVESVSGAIN